MTDTLLVLFGLWCFAVFCFTFGWLMGAAATMAKHADELARRHEALRWIRRGSTNQP